MNGSLFADWFSSLNCGNKKNHLFTIDRAEDSLRKDPKHRSFARSPAYWSMKSLDMQKVVLSKHDKGEYPKKNFDDLYGFISLRTIN